MKTHEECFFSVSEINQVDEFLENKICKSCHFLQNKQVPSKCISDNGRLLANVRCAIPLPVWFYTNENYINFLTAKDSVLTCPAYIPMENANDNV